MALSIIKKTSVKAPYTEQIADQSGLVSRLWQQFITKVQETTNYIGQERQYPLANNQAVAAIIPDLIFDFQYTSQAIIDYLIQRTSSTTELIQSGHLVAVYRPKTLTWSVYDPEPVGDAGAIVFSITATGQVKYTSSNMGGTASISRLVYRVRELAGKSSLYSRVG